jgi:hypothetical protein
VAPISVPSLSAGSNGALSFTTSTDLGTDAGAFTLDGAGDFDFSNLTGLGDGFDFGMYLAEFDAADGDTEGVGILP